MNTNAQGESHPLISILVLNYNGIIFLKDCFDSLLASTYPNQELILVDNNSTDNSIPFVQEKYPQIKIIQTHSNSGYSRAYNIAFRSARGKYYILLNNDVKVEPDWLQPLVEAAEKDQKIGALQPKILSMVDEGYFEYAGSSGGYIDKFGYPFLRGRVFFSIERDTGQYNNAVELFWTSGAAMFIRASALDKSGFLDEDFVHHMEEIDLCWRLLLVGYKLMVIPASRIYHYAGATIKPFSFQKLYWNHRNNIFMMFKNMESKTLWKILPFRLLLDISNFIFAIMKFDFRHAYAIMKAYIWLKLHIFLLLRKRKKVQRNRVVSDEEINQVIYPKSIVFQYFIFGKTTFTELIKNSTMGKIQRSYQEENIQE